MLNLWGLLRLSKLRKPFTLGWFSILVSKRVTWGIFLHYRVLASATCM